MVIPAFQDNSALRPMLTIDTSSAQGSIVLYDGQSLSTRSWPADRSHTTTLLREIHQLLDAAGLEVRDIGAIGIAAGPGAFTGLRVGFGVAKGLYLGTGAPLIGIPTLEATAIAFTACCRQIVATVAAGRGRLVWARYAADGAAIEEVSPPRNGTVEELAGELVGSDGVVVCGELDDAQAEVLATVSGVTVPPRLLRMRQPASLAEVGLRRWHAGRVDDPTSLEPIYLSR
jgi:tRNA threonylcarbamoyladenosine biosynthesis protein TsaB